TDGSIVDSADQGLSSLMDGWIKLEDVEANGERNRTLYLIKARGLSHSNQVREYRITDCGIELIEPYIGPEGVLTGTARFTQAAREQAAAARRQQEVERRQRELTRRREALERQIDELRTAMEADEEEATHLLVEEGTHEATLVSDRKDLGVLRGAAE
ncbi:MAG: ATPase domain-containing protein, partial [Janthinobacterium lividum]